MNNKILHGLEYELQLVAEINGKLETVSASEYLHYKYSDLPQCVTFDCDNIEIQTVPRPTYKEAVENANYILDKKLVIALIEKFKLKKFALFLPSPVCRVYYENRPIEVNKTGEILKYQITAWGSNEPSCMKHWNISFPFHTIKMETVIASLNYDFSKTLEIYHNLADMNISNWKYDYKLLEEKKYPILFKDVENNIKSRIHIKIPYHYSPPEGNPDLMPHINDILIPPDRWKNLVCYFRNGNYIKIRDLV